MDHHAASIADRHGILELALPVGPQLYRTLRARIIGGDLAPGHRLSEAEVALHYHLSRQPVREAFIKLAEEGLLEVRPQRGTYVRKISERAVLDARFVREAVETDVVKELARTADQGLAKELLGQVERQRGLIADDAAGFMVLDDLFHRTLCEAAGHAHAWTVIEGMKSQMDRVRHLTTQRSPNMRLVEHHAAIAQAIVQGDESAAERAMRDHLRKILTDLPIVRASLPEHFDDAGPVIRP